MWDWLGDVIGGLTGSGVGEAIGTAATTAGQAAAAVPWTDLLNVGMQGVGMANQMGAFGPGGLFGGGGEMPDASFGGFGGFGGMGMGGQMPGIQAQTAAGGANPMGIRRAISDVQSQGLSGASPEFLANLAGVTPEELQKLLGYGQA